MVINVLTKPVSMVISFFYTPLLLAYFGEETYGIWATILSVINWIAYFDIGIGNGLRNQLTKDVTLGDKSNSQKSISTAYVVLSIISGIFLVIGSIAIIFMNESAVFNTHVHVKPALQISFTFICINFVLSLSKIQLFATQQSEKVAYMALFTQVLNLLGILLLRTFSQGVLVYVAVLTGLTGIIVNVIFSLKIWSTHREFIPKFSLFRKESVKLIGGLGIKFFIIQIAGLILYTTDSIILTQLFGPVSVTPYHVTYSAFGIIGGVFTAMMAPMWSRYTVAYTKKDYRWIRNIVSKINLLLIPAGGAIVLLAILFKTLAKIWLNRELVYDMGLIPMMGIYQFLYIWSSIYATIMNGTGKINLQLWLAVSASILNIPLSVFFGKYVGLQSTGVALATDICLIITVIPMTVSFYRMFGRHHHKEIEGAN